MGYNEHGHQKRRHIPSPKSNGVVLFCTSDPDSQALLAGSCVGPSTLKSNPVWVDSSFIGEKPSPSVLNTMDIGRDVLTNTIIGSKDSEKVFTPWWITAHHYLVYVLVVLGLVAVPINCMLSVHGNCAYKYDSSANYLLPQKICQIHPESGQLILETRFDSPRQRKMINATFGVKSMFRRSGFDFYDVYDPQDSKLILEQHIKGMEVGYNFLNCLIHPDPKLFGFHVYWHCVNRLSPLALYFPYLVLTLALMLVVLERLLTRYLWTGQRIEKFYELLVKDVLKDGDLESLDTKDKKQKCQQILYDFNNSSFFCKAYIVQTLVKLIICISVLAWSLLDQCNLLRESFKTEFDCKVFDFTHTCSIPSNGMNMIIFDLCNVVLFLIILDATFNLCWHYRFYGQRHSFMQTQLSKLIQTYQKSQPLGTPILQPYYKSPDLQMLLNLLSEKEGIWSALLILCLFDSNFRSEFKVKDTKITSSSSLISKRRKNITLAWNEPSAAAFIGENVTTEHLMYVLEIDPPIDKGDAEGTMTMMPACTVDGDCVFNQVRKTSVTTPPPMGSPFALGAALLRLDQTTNKFPLSRTNSEATSRTTSKDSLYSSATDKEVSIVEGVHIQERFSDIAFRGSSNKALNLRRKTAMILGRKKSAEKVRNFRSSFNGLRSDTEYVITLSFVLSGRKLGSESFTILSHDNPNRKISATSTNYSTYSTPKHSIAHPEHPFLNPTPMAVSSVRKLTPPCTLNSHKKVFCSSDDVKSALRDVGNKLVVLEFIASWCGLCTMIQPKMELLAEDYSCDEKITFFHVDIDECPEISTEFGIEVLPSIVLIHRGEILESFIGQQTDKIEEQIKELLHVGPTSERPLTLDEAKTR